MAAATAAPTTAMQGAPCLWSSEGAVPLSAGQETAADGKQHAQFQPYEFNGGTALGLAGKGFALIAADTRLSKGYSILSRNVSKIAQLNDTVAVATGGCWTDVATLHKTLHTHVDMYEHDHGSDMSASALAQMLSTTLYGRRFFPYYAFNVVAGLDKEGNGKVFTYDAVGSYEEVKYAAQGAGQKLIIPLLDNLVGHRTRTDAAPELTPEEAVRVIKEAFITAGERDIYTGDAVEIVVMTSAGIQKEVFDLKED